MITDSKSPKITAVHVNSGPLGREEGEWGVAAIWRPQLGARKELLAAALGTVRPADSCATTLRVTGQSIRCAVDCARAVALPPAAASGTSSRLVHSGGAGLSPSAHRYARGAPHPCRLYPAGLIPYIAKAAGCASPCRGAARNGQP